MSYTTRRLSISKGQKDKIRKAAEDETSVKIRFSYEDLIDGNDIIALTKTQINAINKAVRNRMGLTISMSSAQLNANKKVGGFLGALLGMATRFLPAIAKTVLPALGVGALSGLASTGVQKAMGNGLYLKKGGCVCSIKEDEKGVHFNEVNGAGLKSSGNGLYLKRGSEVSRVGKGLILGPNSSFKNIPILGMLL